MRLSTDRTERARAMWAKFGAAVARTLLSYERDADLRQDLSQNVFLAVLDSLDRIETAKNPKAYLLRVVHNVAIDHVARESRYTWVELDDDVAADADPEADAHAAGERERLLVGVRRLRLPYRQVLVLALEGLEHEEIAEVLGITRGTVRVRYLRAKERLKEILNAG